MSLVDTENVAGAGLQVSLYLLQGRSSRRQPVHCHWTPGRSLSGASGRACGPVFILQRPVSLISFPLCHWLSRKFQAKVHRQPLLGFTDCVGVCLASSLPVSPSSSPLHSSFCSLRCLCHPLITGSVSSCPLSCPLPLPPFL